MNCVTAVIIIVVSGDDAVSVCRNSPGSERKTVNRHLTLKQYRRLDLFLFAVMLILSESLIVNAAIRWFPDQLYTVSVSAAILLYEAVRQRQ